MIAELPLFLFSTLSGIAAGAYAVSAFVPAVRGTERGRWLFPLTCLVLLGCGLVCTLVHLGHPERFLNALSNPAAMIAQEAYWAMALGVLVLVDVVAAKVKGRSPLAVRWLGVVAACGLMVVTGLAYFMCYGVPVWSAVSTIPLFVVGDVACGFVLVAAFAPALTGETAGKVAAVLVEVALACAMAFEAVVFWQAGESIALPLAGLVVGPVASVGALAAGGRLPDVSRNALVAALTIVGVALVRYGFYACV